MKGGLERWTEKLGSAVSALGATAVSQAQVLGKKLQQEALGAQCLLDYAVSPQPSATGGAGGLWRIHTARSKKEGSPHPLVSAWVLDKRQLTHAEEQLYGGGGALTRPSQRRLEAFLEQQRHDVHALARLKHPGVLRLIAPLEETRTQLVFITEPVFASLCDLLGGAGAAPGGGAAALPPALASERRQLQLSELELKHGLLQAADALHFLHSEAGLVHRGICPASILITQSGAWKLAGFAFSSPQDFQTPNQRPYDYSDSDPSLLQRATQPSLQYVAPELVASGTASITGAADVFSLGAVAFELLARRQLLPVGSSLAEYESKVHSLTLVDMTGVPMGLEATLRSMLAPVATARPPAAAFAGCGWFQSDVLLRALKFLDTMLQRDSVQKAAFLRDLPAMCARFDARILRYKVLPPLLAELRDAALQPTLLPIVLRIVQTQDPVEFGDATLPALKPLLASATGDTLLLLVQNAEMLAKCMPAAAAAQVLPALLVRAAQHGDVRAQEEGLKRTAAMADSLDYEGLKTAVLPAVHTLCLATTSAAVRVSAFAAMSRLVTRMDQPEAEAMLATAVKVTAVDKSAPTAMCVLALGAALAKQWGAKLAAERVLPTLAPLLVAPTLNSQQFATAVKTVRDVLGSIERARSEGGVGGAAAAAPSANGAAPGGAGRGAGAPAAPAPADWLAATEVAAPGGGGGQARPQPASPPAVAAYSGGGDGLLAGLQLQQAASPRAAPAPRPALGGAPMAGGSSFGLSGGQVGAGRPMGAAGMRPAQPMGGGGSSGPAAQLADPFAGLQLGGPSPPHSSSGVQWPPPAPPASGMGAPVFDPFALGSSAAPGGGASSLQWPAPPAQQQQQRPPPAGSGGFPGGSLI